MSLYVCGSCIQCELLEKSDFELSASSLAVFCVRTDCMVPGERVEPPFSIRIFDLGCHNSANSARVFRYPHEEFPVLSP